MEAFVGDDAERGGCRGRRLPAASACRQPCRILVRNRHEGDADPFFLKKTTFRALRYNTDFMALCLFLAFMQRWGTNDTRTSHNQFSWMAMDVGHSDVADIVDTHRV